MDLGFQDFEKNLRDVKLEFEELNWVKKVRNIGL